MGVHFFQYFNHFFLSISLHRGLMRRGNGPKLNEIKWPTNQPKGNWYFRRATQRTHRHSHTIFTISRNTKCKQMESVCKSEKYARRDVRNMVVLSLTLPLLLLLYGSGCCWTPRMRIRSNIYTYNVWGVLSVRLSIGRRRTHIEIENEIENGERS